jgi:epoxyqueuosine reductase
MAQDPGLSFDRIVAEARQIGFDLVGIIPAGPPSTVGHYRTWLHQGYHGEMAYLARPDSVTKREDLSCLLPGVRSVVVVGTNHFAQSMSPEQRDDPSRGVIASYAWSHDYHDFLLSRLRQLADFIEAATGRPVGYRAYVDTGPILERDLAARAGLGFIGKNTNLIHPSFGSWLLLGEILLAIDLPADSYPSHARQTRARLRTSIQPRLNLSTFSSSKWVPAGVAPAAWMPAPRALLSNPMCSTRGAVFPT